MTESSFPFGESAEPLPLEDDVDGGSRRPVLLVGGLVGALVLGAGAFLLLGGSSADPEELGAVPRSPSVSAPAAEPETIAVVPAAAEQPIGRNPFKARYVAPAAAAGGGAAGSAPAGTTTDATTGATTGTTTGATSGTTTGETTGATTGTTTGATSGPTSGTGNGVSKPGSGTSGSTTPTDSTDGDKDPAEQPKQPTKLVELREVNTELNQLSFRVFTREEGAEAPFEDIIVKPGEVFATYFKLFGYGSLKDANGEFRQCADLLYGDARLKLCEGESYQAS